MTMMRVMIVAGEIIMIVVTDEMMMAELTDEMTVVVRHWIIQQSPPIATTFIVDFRL